MQNYYPTVNAVISSSVPIHLQLTST